MCEMEEMNFIPTAYLRNLVYLKTNSNFCGQAQKKSTCWGWQEIILYWQKLKLLPIFFEYVQMWMWFLQPLLCDTYLLYKIWNLLQVQ